MMSDGNDDDNDSDDRLWLGLVGWVWESSPLFIPSNFCSRILLRILLKPHSNFFSIFWFLIMDPYFEYYPWEVLKIFLSAVFSNSVVSVKKSLGCADYECAYYALRSLICTFMSLEGIYRSSGTIELLVI